MKKVLKNIYEYIEHKVQILRGKYVLKNKDFTIISNNCWGGRIYQRYALQYTSPTVGLMFYADEYIKFVSNLRYYVEHELTFIPKTKSKYYQYYKDKEKYYPIGVLDDIEIVFLHYKSEEEAREKWNRRKARINWDNLIVKFNDQNRCTPEHIKAFDKLPYKHKICFVANVVEGTKCTIQFKEFEGQNFIPNDITTYGKYLDIDKYINSLKQ